MFGIHKMLFAKLRRKIIFLSFCASLLFIVLAFFVHKDVFRSVDYQSMMSLQRLFPAWADIPFSILTLTGSSEVILLAIFTIFVFLYIRKKILFTGIFLIVAIYVIELLGKLSIYHPHPPTMLNRYVFSFYMPSSFLVKTNFSFPSGHMARSVFIACIFIYFIYCLRKNVRSRRFLMVLTGFYIISMIISRIYLGEHWLSDVLGGVLLGFSVAGFALVF